MTFDEWFIEQYGDDDGKDARKNVLRSALLSAWAEATYHAYANGYETAIETAAQICDNTKTAGGAGHVLMEVAAEIRGILKDRPLTPYLGEE